MFTYALHAQDEMPAKMPINMTVQYAKDVQPILTKYCAGCHNAEDAEADVQLHEWNSVAKGTPKKPLFQANDPDASWMMQLIKGTHEPKMPPVDEPQPTEAEVALITRWIEQGAKGGDVEAPLRSKLNVPKLPTKSRDAMPITALALTPSGLLLGSQDRISVKKSQWTTNLDMEVTGKVSQIRVSKDGSMAVVASGIPGVGGQVTIVSFVHGKVIPVRAIEAHRDALYSAVLSPDRRYVATAGYDRIIRIWRVEDGSLVKELTGHNGAVYDLDFDPTGTVIASASADETIKVWNVASGERLDTYGQCEAEQYVVRFSPDGKRVLAAGADKRIRVWKLQSLEKASVSPMLYSTFAHETPVVAMSISPDQTTLATAGEDGSIKLWQLSDTYPLGEIGRASDVPSAMLWTSESKLVVSSLDGRLTYCDASKKNQSPAAGQNSSQVKPSPTATDLSSVKLVEVSEAPEKRTATTAQRIPNVSRVSGSISVEDSQHPSSGDWYAFESKAGDTTMIAIETNGTDSLLDSFVDILDAEGNPILRTRLQAVRESYFTFRGKDSTIADDFRLHRWEDMELNEYLYAGGEVVRLWLYPRGPDSGFKVYPGEKSRYTYFDTTATTHALNEPAWIVRELQPGQEPIPNGLPVFPIYYCNDDESTRKSGKDSKITFTAPADGEYLVRVRDNRGLGGEKYKYRLTLQPPNPRFKIQAEPKEIALRSGVGSEFTIAVDRRDGLDEKIELIAENVPDGITITNPLDIEAGQIQAAGTLFVSKEKFDSLPMEFELKLTPKSSRGLTSDSVTLKVKRQDKTAMQFKVIAKDAALDAAPLTEIVVRAGTTSSAMMVIERGDLKGDISFGKEDSGRNLPHGVYVDNIGLSGLLIPNGQSSREVFITAAPWVSPQTRQFHIKAAVDGKPTTQPIVVKIVRD
jgi:WD40 repeat protein